MKSWTTATGDVINIKDTEVSHVENCIKMLSKKIVDPYDVHGYENGAESSYTHFLIIKQNETLEMKINAFEKELKSRKNKFGNHITK